MVNTEETDAIILVHHMVRPSETLDPTFPTIQLRLFLSISHPYFFFYTPPVCTLFGLTILNL